MLSSPLETWQTIVWNEVMKVLFKKCFVVASKLKSLWAFLGHPFNVWTVFYSSKFWEWGLFLQNLESLFILSFRLGRKADRYLHACFNLSDWLKNKEAIRTLIKHSIEIEVYTYRDAKVQALDKIKPVFIYCRFNPSCIRKTVFEKRNTFAFF